MQKMIDKLVLKAHNRLHQPRSRLDAVVMRECRQGLNMTKKELLKALEKLYDDAVVICMDDNGGWDNILHVIEVGSSIAIVFGGASTFSDAR